MCSFNKNTHPERTEVLSIIKNNGYVDISNFGTPKEYVKNLSKYKFSICPRGNGSDTHRFWESLMVGTFPIVAKTPFTKNLESMGIPALYLDNWSDLNHYNSQDLNELFIELKKRNLYEYLLFEFWKKILMKRLYLNDLFLSNYHKKCLADSLASEGTDKIF